MRVELAEKAGFCFGVNRAVDTVYKEALQSDTPVYTFGPIIHNEEVIADLSQKGVHMINTLEEAAGAPKGTMILRSHGVPRDVKEALQHCGHTLVDATCPFVQKIHDIVQTYSEKGYFVLIIGSEDHPEVQGIVGWTRPGTSRVISSVEEAKAFSVPKEKKLCIVAQTTFHHKKFQDIVEIIQEKGYDNKDYANGGENLIIRNTICSATRERQDAARALSCVVDAMIVVGGVSSSNTRKLYEICSEHCKNTYFIQTKEDLEHSDFSRFDYVGITAGASTPNNIIEEVQKYVRKF